MAAFETVAACGALIVTESTDRHGAAVLRASTAGGFAEMTPTEAKEIGQALVAWAEQRKAGNVR
jgi:hypothetical protein